MEDWQTELIRRNLPQLVHTTYVTGLLLAVLQIKDVISFADYETIQQEVRKLVKINDVIF